MSLSLTPQDVELRPEVPVAFFSPVSGGSRGPHAQVTLSRRPLSRGAEGRLSDGKSLTGPGSYSNSLGKHVNEFISSSPSAFLRAGRGRQPCAMFQGFYNHAMGS